MIKINKNNFFKPTDYQIVVEYNILWLIIFNVTMYYTPNQLFLLLGNDEFNQSFFEDAWSIMNQDFFFFFVQFLS